MAGTDNAVLVVGAGAFGTALALAFARAGRAVTLLGRDPVRMAAMRSTRQAGDILPGIAMEDGVTPASDPALAAAFPLVVMAVPTQALWQATRDLAPHLHRDAVLISAAKGIERSTGYFVTESMRDAAGPHEYGVLSGPSFAIDIARGLPTAIVLAMREESEAARLARHLSSPGLRLYHSTDLRGVEIGGAAKNVLAIAAGIVVGMGLGESARAAIVTRGFAELRRYAIALGAQPETLMGLSGLGDLVLTAASTQSRNFALGLELGKGRTLAEANPGGKLAEGAFTAGILIETAARRGVEMPISEAVASVLDGRSAPADAMRTLMARPLKGE